MILNKQKSDFLLLALDNLVRTRGLEFAENAVILAKEIKAEGEQPKLSPVTLAGSGGGGGT